MKLRRVPQQNRVRLSKKRDAPVNGRFRPVTNHRVQTGTGRTHLALPLNFHEQLSKEGKGYWNQLTFEEQNRMIQQCRSVADMEPVEVVQAVQDTVTHDQSGPVHWSGGSQKKAGFGRLYEDRWYTEPAVPDSGNRAKTHENTVLPETKRDKHKEQAVLDSSYVSEPVSDHRGYCHAKSQKVKIGTKRLKVKVRTKYLKVKQWQENSLSFYILKRASIGKYSRSPDHAPILMHKKNRCRKKRKALKVFLPLAAMKWENIKKRRNPSVTKRHVRYIKLRRYRKHEVRNATNSGKNPSQSLEGCIYNENPSQPLEGDIHSKNPGPEHSPWKKENHDASKKKASEEKKKNSKLTKKQVKKLISRIEYLAALSGSARNKEGDQTQGLTFSSKLVYPFAKLSLKTVWNFVRSSRVVAMLTANTAQALSGLFSAFSAALSSMLLPFLAIVLPIALAVCFIVSLIPAFNLTDSYSGAASQYDAYCYLTAKYESGGDAASVGADVGYLAYGEFQFYYLYELRPFVRWCHEKDPAFYKPFEAYLNMDVSQVPGEDFRSVWKGLAESNYSAFELDQEEYICTFTLEPTLTALTEKYGYDFNNASAALKACVLSFANRSGKSMATLSRYFDGTTSLSTDAEIINRAYAAMYEQRPIRRWDSSHEWKDCLDQMEGTLDIYEKSENDAGGIDWSWKKTEPGRIVDSTGDDIVDYALQFVGNSYVWGGDSLTGGIDCSHFIWRVLLNTGHYSGGYLTSGDWRTVGQRVDGLSQAIAGDVICYEGHVAFYDGNGYVVEAKNSREGITHDEKADYMPIVCIRRVR